MLIKSDQAAVERSDVHLAAIEGHAAIYYVTTNEEGALARHLGIVGPAELTGLGVDGVHHTPGTGGVDDAVFHQRRRFQSARGAEVAAPGQAQFADGFLADLLQRTEPMVVVGPPVHQPIVGVLIAVSKSRVVKGRCPAARTDKEDGENYRGHQAALQHWAKSP